MIQIQTNFKHFPWDIFSDTIYNNFKHISKNFNIPIDYLGVEALFSIGSLSGNMYVADMNGGAKPILYIAKIGPSTVGKTPAHHKICGDIIKPLRIENDNDYRQRLKEYKQRQRDAVKTKHDFDEDPPIKKIRIIEGGTVEAIAKHSTTSPAGFGVIYDEGARMFTDATGYSKSSSAVEFWNEMFNGKTYELTRVDSERERFIQNAGVSVNIGLQSDRMDKYFDEDTLQSGLLNRFLIVESDYMELNERVDFFNKQNNVCDEWRQLMIYLFKKGVAFEAGTQKLVEFTEDAKLMLNGIGNKMIRESNIHIKTIKQGDPSKYIASYRGKLFGYLPRLALILAIYKNPHNPVITEKEIWGADKLCEYFQQTANKVLRKLFQTGNTGLNENEKALYDALPQEFNTERAVATCLDLGLNENFFAIAFVRKYKKGFIIRKGRGSYEKI